VALRNTMIDADIVAVDHRVFFAVGLEITADAGKIRQRKCIQVVSRKRRKAAATRTIAQIVTWDRSAVWSEDRADRCGDCAAARNPVIASGSRSQQLAEIANTHSRRRHWNAERITCTAKD